MFSSNVSNWKPILVKLLNFITIKSLKIKLAAIAFFLIVGSVSASAQMCKGNCIKLRDCTTQTGTCVTQLTDEQQTILDNLRAGYQEAKAELRAEMLSATTFADKIAIRAEMVDLRTAHLAEVQALLEEWGIK